MGEEQVSRGIATADVDGDGRLDFAVANQWSPSSFYRNRAPGNASFLGLRLLRPASGTPATTSVRDGHQPLGGVGRPAVGAQVRVALPDGRRWVAEVDGGNGHSGARSPDPHFGLGEVPEGTSLAVELRWRDASGQLRHRSVQLAPGWHTIVLGEDAEVVR
jgi:hypothetical protein